jgi:hypothetical protein
MQFIESTKKACTDAGQPCRYGAEVLCASWNPQVTVLAEPAGDAGKGFEGRGSLEVASFLARFYRSQST